MLSFTVLSEMNWSTTRIRTHDLQIASREPPRSTRLIALNISAERYAILILFLVYTYNLDIIESAIDHQI